MDGDSNARSADVNRTRPGTRNPLAAHCGPYRISDSRARHPPARLMGTAASYWSYGLISLKTTDGMASWAAYAARAE